PHPPPPPGPPPPPVPETGIRFTRVLDAGLDRAFVTRFLSIKDPERFSNGIAAADYDADQDIDLYIVGGRTHPNHLYQNRGDGTFVEVAASIGLDVTHWGSGPVFGDVDGDGDLDLFVGSGDGDPVYLFENRLQADTEPSGVFVDRTAESGIAITTENTVSAAFHDYDRDGYLDLFMAHWGAERRPGEDTETVWRNNGDFTFTSTSIETGIAAAIVKGGRDWSFTPNLSDIDADGDADLLMVSDLNNSEVLINNGDGTFMATTDRNVIDDQAGMGAAVGDYDNDGDMDWFVTSIYTLDVGGEHYGNRLYRNDGTGVFTDVTTESEVQDGGWGWGSCFADFDNDGHLDIFHVNGWHYELDKDFTIDQVRFFHSQGNGIFDERAEEVGLVNKSQGRAVVCFDAERDGDIDIAIVNNSSDHLVYYRNDLNNDSHYLGVKLDARDMNTHGVGAWITVTTTLGEQVRELRAGSNYASQNPLEAHFGLGTARVADVEVRWPDGSTTTLNAVAADQLLTVTQGRDKVLRLTVVRGDGDGIYAEGDEIEIESDAATRNYHFSHWTSEGGGSFADMYAARTVFTMPDNRVTLVANYLPGVALSEDVSVARRWNEVLLQSIRNDWARPTVHARNLFHSSAAMYDIWAAYSDNAAPWLLGRTRSGVECARETFPEPDDVDAAREEAISHAVYRIIFQRFRRSPGVARIRRDINALMSALGHDPRNDSTDYTGGSAAALGNHIGQCYLEFGLADGANEANDYVNTAYEPVNPPLRPDMPGNPDIVDLNRWQPLSLETFIDQAGNPAQSEPEFLSPEWGHVVPFALTEADLVRYDRDGFTYWVYHDPGMPPTIDGSLAESYKWGFSLVSIWSSHLSPDDGVTVDISPASLGNVQDYPRNFEDYPDFFDTLQGGDPGTGYDVNPVTGDPYARQVVPRGDYSRVLAEFWADGPDSETPPGHWFTILNEVNEHDLLERRFRGMGQPLDHLEWDVKAYFALGGAMHDAAITAWGIKGWYDYLRPVSAIRAMADRGQSSDAELAAYHVDGIPLEDGYIELVETGDDLAGENDEHVGKIKLLAWRGPDHIDDPETDAAGVDWILAENWWPYQRPTFVTPPFAGYVSGHSTYSRAAAEVLTALTGDEYFPGGMSGFEIRANEFLVFEEGPSVDMTLQWATYQDASDQTSLSRIWGGIHPPADDLPGRLIGIDVGRDAFALAESYFDGTAQP
ncbi:MAG: hypothetical protein F4X98_08500, partial [Gammaproteobacteria bacterium]|nr:hypothetical protein [Gammaproteobacteria bacterium]